MKYYLLTALGKDQVGIVAGVTEVLAEMSCNIEDSSMTKLKNEFAMLLVIKSPDKLKEQTLLKKLKQKNKQRGLLFQLKPLMSTELKVAGQTNRRAMLNIYGADRIGIVATVSKLLAKFKFNIEDLYTNLTGKGIYIMHFELLMPDKFASDKFDLELNKVKSRLSVDANFQIVDTASL